MKLLITLAGTVLVTSAAPAPAAQEDPGVAVQRALAAQGPIVTDADNAAIRAKCGLPASSAPLRNLNFTNGALHCPDGKVVRDDETRAMGVRIGARASAHVHAAMSDPKVKAAIDTYASTKAREALRKAGMLRD